MTRGNSDDLFPLLGRCYSRRFVPQTPVYGVIVVVLHLEERLHRLGSILHHVPKQFVF